MTSIPMKSSRRRKVSTTSSASGQIGSAGARQSSHTCRAFHRLALMAQKSCAMFWSRSLQPRQVVRRSVRGPAAIVSGPHALMYESIDRAIARPLVHPVLERDVVALVEIPPGGIDVLCMMGDEASPVVQNDGFVRSAPCSARR